MEKGITVVRPLLEKKGLSISVEVPADLPPIYCDRVRIQQVILNLLSNAARFTEKGGISLIATLDSQQVTLRVQDTGSGIPLEDHERIFEPFWQGRDPIWQKRGGSGIGLSLSREFVRLHGGHMWFESELRQGSAFFFNLPISPLIEPLARPGRQIKDDWVWKENSFLSAQIGNTSELVKPRVIVYDETDTLYSRFVHYTDKVEFVNIHDISEFSREGMSKALILNAPSIEKLWPMVQAAVNSPTPTTVIGCSVPGEYRRALETGATGYLIKPIKMDDLNRIIQSTAQPVRRVLILDDDLDVLGLYQRMIQAFAPEMEVCTFSSGRAALDAIQRQPPDLMLLDIVMPEMNGWQVLEEIGRMDTPRPFPIYFITAQDPIDHLVSGYILATIKGGVPLGKLLNVSMEISSLLMESEREPGPEPEPDLEDELV
jgi:CheY-like chemotaxis protein